MSSLVGNLILETCSAPGNAASIALAGAPQGRRPFSSRFTNGQQLYYFMHDGANWEAGLGTFGAGTPSTITRPGSVLSNSQGTTARINFLGATNVYSEIPAEVALTTSDFASSLQTNGWARSANGTLEQWGTSSSTNAQGQLDISFPISFPVACRAAHPVIGGASAVAALAVVIGPLFTTGFSVLVCNSSTGAAVAGVGVHWRAIGY